MKKMMLAAIAVAALSLSACSDPKGAEHALKVSGFKEIHITGYRFFGCANGKESQDTFHTGFTAVGPSGEKATGVVCSGWLKGSTVRID